MVPAEARDPKTYAIIGAAMEVHKELGCGFLEHAYQEAMMIELTSKGVPFTREVVVPIYYKGHCLNCQYRADFICYGELIVEIKAIKQLTSVERAQVINYLKGTGYRVALLINFGAESLQYERVVLTTSFKPNPTQSA